ncbi:MAG: Bug family tripartite tricarboxylate transporter substrate binding protein [Gemmatimonas sp.]
MGSLTRVVVASVAGLTVLAGSASAQSLDAFYRTHSLNIIVGTEPGGGYGVYSRLLARFLPPRLPGEPEAVVQYMPGASGRRAAEYLYTVAPRDGSVIGTIEQNIPTTQVIAQENVRFDVRDFNYLGNLAPTVSTVVVWHTTGVRSIEDAKTRELVIGATGVTGTTKVFAKLVNDIVGTKFRVVPGYKSGTDLDLAMQRGEIDGRASYAWASLKSGHPDWLRDGKVNILLQIGLRKSPDLSEVPLLLDYASSNADRDIVRLFSASLDLGRVFLAPPQVPGDRLAALRKAFDGAVADPEFRAEAAKLGVDVTPINGHEVQRIIAALTSTSPEVVARARAYLD